MSPSPGDIITAGRSYMYDPDGRPTQIQSTQHTFPQEYSYNVDGNLISSRDASTTGDSASRAKLTYNRYLDGTLKSLDVAYRTLNQTALFTYSYRNDGPLETEMIDDSSLGSTIDHPGQTELAYTYTDAGRLLTRLESGSGNSGSTTLQYYMTPALGLVKSDNYASCDIVRFWIHCG